MDPLTLEDVAAMYDVPEWAILDGLRRELLPRLARALYLVYVRKQEEVLARGIYRLR